MLNDWRSYIVIIFALFNVVAFLIARDESLLYLQHLHNYSKPATYSVSKGSSKDSDVVTEESSEDLYLPSLPPTQLAQLNQHPASCQYSTMLSCLFHENKDNCVWCPTTQQCLDETTLEEDISVTCPHWCGSQIGFSEGGYDAGVGTFNQVQLYIDMVLLARALHMVYVPLPLFTTRFSSYSGGIQFPATHAFDYAYIHEYLTNYTCILSPMPAINTNFMKHGGARVYVPSKVTWSTDAKFHQERRYELRNHDYIAFDNWMFQYIIDSVEDNNLVAQYWRYFKTNITLENAAIQVMKDIYLEEGKFLAVHLRVEADWADPPYSRTFPLPSNLVSELQKYSTNCDVYLACGEPLTSSHVAPYVGALEAAGYTVKTKPDFGNYFPDCAQCFDLASLVDFNILSLAHTTFGVQLSTFYQGVYNTRRIRGQSAVILERVDDAEIWSGYIPSEWNETLVKLLRNKKLQVLGKQIPKA